MRDLNALDFLLHAQRYGVYAAAMMFRNEDWQLNETLCMCRIALRGQLVQYRLSWPGFAWLSI